MQCKIAYLQGKKYIHLIG